MPAEILLNIIFPGLYWGSILSLSAYLFFIQDFPFDLVISKKNLVDLADHLRKSGQMRPSYFKSIPAFTIKFSLYRKTSREKRVFQIAGALS